MKNLDSILPISDEGLFPIRTVSEITGVNSITLRAWERRYDLFQPKRSPKGHRLYSEKDIQRVQEVLALLEKGVSIGRVAKVLKVNHVETDLPNLLPEKSKKVKTSELSEKFCTDYKNDILKSISNFDLLGLESIHHKLLSNYSIESISKKIIIPNLIELETNAKKLSSLSSEYSFYRVFILYRLGGLCLKTSMHNTGKKLLLMGLEDEHCDVEMLLFTLPLLQHGFEIVTLGCNVTLDSIPKSTAASNAEGLLLYTNLCETDSSTLTTLNSVVNNINCPIFITDQTSNDLNQELKKSGVTILPLESGLQIELISKKLQ